MATNGFDEDSYCRRLRLLRKLYGMNQTEFADWVGIPYGKWNHYERGYPVPRETAFVLHQKIPGISIDWLWFGQEDGLSRSLLLKLASLQQEELETIRRARRPRRLTKVRRRISKIDT